jgi:hypothetical protein
MKPYSIASNLLRKMAYNYIYKKQYLRKMNDLNI